MTVNKLTSPISQNDLINKTNEIIDNLGGGGASTDVQINSTSITSDGVANIVTNSAYNASSNKIATMSDLPDNELFVAIYGTTTFNEVWTAYDAGKTVFVKDTTIVSGEVIAVLNYFEFNSALDTHFEFASSILNDGTYYTYTLDQDSTWDKYTEQISDTTYTGGTGISIGTGNAINHTNSITAGTIGTSSATSGSTISVPYATYDAQGHITAKGTHTHTVTGFLTSSSSYVASSRFDGQWVNNFQTIVETSGTQNGVQFSLSSYLPNDSYKYDVKFKIFGYDDDSSYSYFINTDIFWMPSTSSDLSYPYSHIYGGTYSRHNTNIFNLPVGTGRYIKLYGSGADTIRVYAFGYRRIGTNT